MRSMSGTIRPARSRTRRRGLRLDPRGQSLVEFAISAPVVFLMLLFGIDFGRVFLGWITLGNVAREAANFAALNPFAWAPPYIDSAQEEYDRLINAEAAGINCAMPETLPEPTFPGGTDIGSPAVVAITCRFSLITPIISNLLGDSIPVSASAAFPVRNGVIEGTPGGGVLPTLGPTPIPTPSQLPAGTPIPTPSAIPTPVPTCVVPDLVGQHAKTAVKTWTNAGFVATNLVFQPLVGAGNPVVTGQSPLDAGTSVSCSSTMTATN